MPGGSTLVERIWKFIPASNEPSSRTCADIWRMPRGSDTQAHWGGKNKLGHAPMGWVFDSYSIHVLICRFDFFPEQVQLHGCFIIQRL